MQAQTNGSRATQEEVFQVMGLSPAAIASTSDAQKAMICVRWQQMRTYAEIAAVYGCTPENVRQHIEKGNKRIRKGKYARELISFLPDRAVKQAERKLSSSFQDLSEIERGLLM